MKLTVIPPRKKDVASEGLSTPTPAASWKTGFFKESFPRDYFRLALHLPRVFNSGISSSRKRRPLEASTTVDNQVVSCPAPAKAGPPPVSVTISEAKNTLTLACNGAEVAAVPSTLNKGTVCVSAPEKTLKTCKAANAGPNDTTTVSQLLGSESEIVWLAKEKSASASYGLKIEKKDFPYLDKTFFVGCMKETPDNFQCQVNVTVKARASSVDSQVATCSYGESSNPSALEVTMTPEKNTFTLVCGKEGTSVPEEFKTDFCPGDDVGECRTPSPYGSILPGFASEWWSTSTDGSQHTLTIPAEHFPAKEQSFLVGCVPRKETATKSQTPTCSVKVTVRPKQHTSNAAHAAAGLFYIFALTLASSVLF